MKTLYIILTIIALALCVFAGTMVMELRKEKQIDQATIDGLNLKVITEKKVFEKIYDAQQKDFSRQLDSMARAHTETLKAAEASKREIKKLKGILFVQHTDSSRTAELKQLYKSYTP